MIAVTNDEKFSAMVARLIALKSERDNRSFTCYKLAKAIGVDRSIVQRLVNGEIENPRLDTFLKIISFFINDGFHLTLKDFVPQSTKVVDVQSQPLRHELTINLPLYQMNNYTGERIGSTSIVANPEDMGMDTIAFVSNESLPPFFQAGTIFVVKLMKRPKHDNLVLVKVDASPHLVLYKIIVEQDEEVLCPLDGGNAKISVHDFQGKILTH